MVLVLAAGARAAAPPTYVVDGNAAPGPYTYATIAEAAAAAPDGAVIQVVPGLYDEAVVLDGRDLTFVSSQPQMAVLATSRDFFSVSGGSLELEGFAVTGGTEALVVAILSAAVTLKTVYAHDLALNAPLVSVYGGALAVEDSTFVAVEALFDDPLTHSVIDADFAAVTLTGVSVVGSVSGSGAVGVASAPLTVTGSTFTDNVAVHYGGAIWVGFAGASLTLAETVFTANVATNQSGGAVKVYGMDGPLTITACDFASNTAPEDGGAIAIHDNPYGVLPVDVEIVDTTFSYNRATAPPPGWGGGALSIHPTSASPGIVRLDVLRTEFCDNTAGVGSGGAIHALGTDGMIHNAAFVANKAAAGGAVALEGDAFAPFVVRNVDFARNQVDTTGSALDAGGVEVDLRNTLFHDHAVEAVVGTAVEASYNAWSDTAETPDPASGVGNVLGDPLLTDVGSYCVYDLRPLPDSPLLGAGDPALAEAPRTDSDIGMWGGPGAGDDADGDGWHAGLDCDEADAGVHPLADEVCDGVDQDCDEEADDGLVVDWFVDQDQDGWGVGAPTAACAPPDPTWVLRDGDCDDTDRRVHPNAVENANDGTDDDCDGADRRETLSGSCACDGGAGGSVPVIGVGLLLALRRRGAGTR